MSLFRTLFNAKPTAEGIASGRVNLMGEHTDYNGGFVLPTTIPQATTVCIALAASREVRVASSTVNSPMRVQRYRLGYEKRCGSWLDYVQGVTWLLAREGLLTQGFDALVSSTVPMGAGLSSSAALLVALFRALRTAFSLPLEDLRIAQLSQIVENEFVGARVGIMDQMAASLGEKDTALFLDTRSLAYRHVPLPKNLLDIFIVNSGVKHSNVSGDYNMRRSECEQACQALGVAQLRDVDPANMSQLDALPAVLAKRARHVVTENARVLAAVAALEAGDIPRLGALFLASHASMREDFEVSIPAIDALVESALAEPDVFGARLTGGGFGGSIVGICAPGKGPVVAERVASRYARDFGP